MWRDGQFKRSRVLSDDRRSLKLRLMPVPKLGGGVRGSRPSLRSTPGDYGRHPTLSLAEGEYLLHDLENVGGTDLVFSTVEFRDSANPPLPLD